MSKTRVSETTFIWLDGNILRSDLDELLALAK